MADVEDLKRQIDEARAAAAAAAQAEAAAIRERSEAIRAEELAAELAALGGPTPAAPPAAKKAQAKPTEEGK